MNQKVIYFEGLRGIASLAVVFTHYYGGWYLSPKIFDELDPFVQSILKSPLSLIWNGNLAVCIFFVLSGYVLTCKYFETKKDQIIISGAIRRYWRLCLPSLISMVIAYLILSLGLFFNLEVYKITSSDWIFQFWKQEPRIMSVIYEGIYGVFVNSDNSTYNAVLWTMEWEFIGSFMVFVLCLLFGKLFFRGYIYMAVALLLITKPFLLAFLAGMVLSDLKAQNNSQLSRKILTPKNGLILLVMGLALAHFSTRIGQFFPIFSAQYVYSFAGVFIVFAVLTVPCIQKPMESRLCVYLGKIAFSLYLVHLPILCSFSCYLFLYNLKQGFSYDNAYFLMILPALAVTFIIAHLFWKFVDEPAVAVSRSIESIVLEKWVLIKSFVGGI